MIIAWRIAFIFIYGGGSQGVNGREKRNSMGMRIYISPFLLMPRLPLNSRCLQVAPRRGVLIRREDGGVGCIQPWTELGDDLLEDELEALRASAPLRLGRRALACALADGAARAMGKSLFSAEEEAMPLSHASLPAQVGEQELLRLHEAGFRCGKIKVSRHNQNDVDQILERGERLSWMWRFDMNGGFSVPEYQAWSAAMWARFESFYERIEFVEDPVPYDLGAWAGLPLWPPLAQDRGGPDISREEQDIFDKGMYVPPYRVIKSAWEDALLVARGAIERGQRIVVTSYMDHPVGQSWAAYEAEKVKALYANSLALCGLMTQELYEPNSFSECLPPLTPRFRAAEGTGLGFDSLLDKLPWARL